MQKAAYEFLKGCVVRVNRESTLVFYKSINGIPRKKSNDAVQVLGILVQQLAGFRVM